MRTSAIALSVVSFMASLVASASADVSISEAWHVDPRWEAGGYWELTVTNLSGADIYWIAVGNTGVDLVAVRVDLVGVWAPDRVNQEAWDLNDWGRHPVDWTFPDTSTLPFASEFPGYAQVLVYYTYEASMRILDGAVFDGLRFNYPVELVASSRSWSASGGAPFIAFNGVGEVVARGETVGPPLSASETTWGAIKALYR